MKQIVVLAALGALLTVRGFAEGEAMVEYQKATFAGGCFWCMEAPFKTLPGVIRVVAGYSGGHVKNPTYEQVCSGTTGHAEVVQITYDPKQLSYQKLVDVFWRQIDPTTVNQQFADYGTQYRSAIFYHDDEQKRIAEASRDALAQTDHYKGKKIVTEISPAAEFWPAEDYHQEYYKKNPQRYQLYREGSGRSRYLEKVWGKEGH